MVIKALLQAAVHAVAQGTLAMVQSGGAGFFSGASAGFFGSMGATAWSAGVGGKFARSAVGTIAFGALSGGVGAELAGGNFWEGAVTGGVVAGLNDVMHKMAEGRSLRKKIEKGGLNPDAKPEMTSEFITKTLNKNIEGLQVSYEAGSKPSFIFSDGISTNVAEHNLSSTTNRITIYKNNVKNIYRLVSSLFHEYRHAWQIMTPYYATAQKMYGPLGPEGTYSPLRSLIEWDAYNYQINIGGELDGFILGQRDLMKKYFEHK